MASRVNALPPSLTSEFADIKRRLTAIERRPEPLARYDRYPPVEWSAISRDKMGGNVWSSCGMANVTGLTFDRVEVKFMTDRLMTGTCEAEVRLAAFRHDLDAGAKECVSASSTINLIGQTTRSLGTIYVRWIHGIPFGWDYQDGAAIYTIELQHRYKVGPTPEVPDKVHAFMMYKQTNKAAPTKGGMLAVDPGSEYSTAVLGGSNMGNVSVGWVPVGDPYELDPYNGNYSISNMHYCVGLPEDRLPTASTGGHWRWRGTNGSLARNPDITEEFLST